MVKTPLISLGVFLAAFFPRLFLLQEYKANDPYFDAFMLDAETYYLWAREIFYGDWMGTEIFYHAPLYAYFTAAVFKIVGSDLLDFFLFQVGLSSGTAVLLYLAGREFFGEKSGIIAALLFSFTDLFAFYSLKLLPATLAVFLLALFVLVFRLAEKKSRSYYWISAGFIAGAASLAGANFLLLFPVALFYFLFIAQGEGWEKARKILAFTISFLCVVSLSAIHNYMLGKDFVLVAANGGETFYHGNNVNAEGTYAYPPEISPSLQFQNVDARRVAEKEAGRPLKTSEVSRYWFRKALEFIFADPWRYLILELKKARLLLSGMDTSIIYYMDFERREFIPRLGLFFIDYAAILPLALAGLWVTRREWKENFILLGVLGMQAATLLAFFVTTRYRLPMVPFLILFGARAVGQLDRRFYRRGLFYGLMGLMVFSLCIHRWERKMYPPDMSALYCNLGYTMMDRRKFDKALEMFEKARGLNPNNILPYLGLVSLHAFTGAKAQAMEIYGRLYPLMHPRMVEETKRDPALAPIREEINAFLLERGR